MHHDSQSVLPTAAGTAIAMSTTDAIYVRGHDLTKELMGHISFTDMIFLHLRGRRPEPAETAIIDAILVALMEHGLTPSSISARLIYSSSPDSLQSAVAGGLLGAGSTFLGAMEDLAALLQDGAHRIAANEITAEALCDDLIATRLSAGQVVPGFGHHIHRPDDPRTPRLLELATEHGIAGEHVALLASLSAAMDRAKGRHITVNVTGAIAAVLSDMEFPWSILRGFSLIARSAGLVGHLLEEQSEPLGRELWDLVERGVPYTGPAPA